MKKSVFCIYDKVTDIYQDVALFDSFEVAFASYRRMFRDLYIKGNITKDALKDLIIYGVAYFDTKTGSFENWFRGDWIEINVSGLLSDIGDEESKHEVSD